MRIQPRWRKLVSASTDGTLKIWNAITGEIRHNLTGHTHCVSGCAISPDGTWLVSADVDRMLKSGISPRGINSHFYRP